MNLHGLRISLFSRMNFPSFLFLTGNSGTLYTYKINQTIHIFLSGSYLLFNETNSSNHCQTIEVFNKSSYIYQKVLQFGEYKHQLKFLKTTSGIYGNAHQKRKVFWFNPS